MITILQLVLTLPGPRNNPLNNRVASRLEAIAGRLESILEEVLVREVGHRFHAMSRKVA